MRAPWMSTLAAGPGQPAAGHEPDPTTALVVVNHTAAKDAA